MTEAKFTHWFGSSPVTYHLVNPDEYYGSADSSHPMMPTLVDVQIGAPWPTHILVWVETYGRAHFALDEVVETAAEWAEEHAPGLFVEGIDDLLAEARADLGPGASEEEVEQKATADLWYTESGWLTSYELSAPEVPWTEPLYELAVKTSYAWIEANEPDLLEDDDVVEATEWISRQLAKRRRRSLVRTVIPNPRTLARDLTRR